MIYLSTDIWMTKQVIKQQMVMIGRQEKKRRQEWVTKQHIVMEG